MLHSNLSINDKGHLVFAGRDTVDLAKEFGTPLYLMDENKIRDNCRIYVQSMSKYFGNGSVPIYAGKALSYSRMYKMVAEEGMNIDIASTGELATALKAKYPPENIYYHGNNKTDADISFAMEKGVGYIVIDNEEELDAVNEIAREKGLKQKALLRLTPGIDPHTFEAVNTGKIDSKFGVAIETGQAIEFLGKAVSAENIELVGIHCHIGSQIFDWIPYRDASTIMLEFIRDAKNKYGYEAKVLDLGGGFGVRYTENDSQIDIEKCIEKLSVHIKSECSRLGINYPSVLMEPGRSIVGNAGITLYSAGSVKTITGYKSYVSVDGGMCDNPRYALYKSDYTVLVANKMNESSNFHCTIAGRCCESGALIQEDIDICKPVRGDIIAVLVTGAYNYSMASNYNGFCRPPVVAIRDGKPHVVVKRETNEDMLQQDVLED